MTDQGNHVQPAAKHGAAQQAGEIVIQALQLEHDPQCHREQDGVADKYNEKPDDVRSHEPFSNEE